MRKIVVENCSTLTEFSALFRAGLYLSGRTQEAQENKIIVRTRRGVKDVLHVRVMDRKDVDVKEAAVKE